MLKRCRDVVSNSDQVIIVLDDDDIKELLHLRKSKGENGVSEYMQKKLNQVLM